MNLLSDNYLEKQKELVEETKWIDDIIENSLCCVICFYHDNPLILEKHHIAGKNNSNFTITVCPICHRILSNKQSSWNNDWNNEDNSIEMKIAFYLKGRSEVLKLMAEHDKEISDKILNGDG